MKSVSIFIRAKNEATALQRTLLAISKQEFRPDEVVVLDNESEDQTCEVAKSLGAVVEKISLEQFSFGRALNRSLDVTRGEIIVFLSAHSPPLDEQWLGRLVEPLKQGEAPAAFGRQSPEPGVNHFEEWFLYRTFPRHPSLLLKVLGLQKITFSNSNAAVLRTLLQDHRFREDLAFAEDIEWAQRIQREGYQISYCPEAAVFNSHGFGPGDLATRMHEVGYAMGQCGSGEIYNNSFSCLFAYLASITVDLLYCLTKGYWSKILQIPKYRYEYFHGIRRGLTAWHKESC